MRILSPGYNAPELGQISMPPSLGTSNIKVLYAVDVFFSVVEHVETFPGAVEGIKILLCEKARWPMMPCAVQGMVNVRSTKVWHLMVKDLLCGDGGLYDICKVTSPNGSTIPNVLSISTPFGRDKKPAFTN